MFGVVDVGGGLRGIYGAGIFDYCLDNDVKFDYGIGVSAGSANIVSYISKQPRRNYKSYTEISFRKEYMSIGNFLRTGSYLDLDYIYTTICLPDGDIPLDYQTFAASDMQFKIVAADARDGKVVYFDKSDVGDQNYDVFKASSCLPLICKPYFIDGVPYYDGGIVDPIPIEKAFADGCDKLLLILTRPINKLREQSKRDLFVSKMIKKKYPQMATAVANRYKVYNDSLELAKKYAEQGKIFILAPDESCVMDTLTKDKEKLKTMYDMGYNDAAKLFGRLNNK